MKIVAHTPVGVFVSKEFTDEAEVARTTKLIEDVSHMGNFFYFLTDKGSVTIAKQTLKNSVFELVN